VNEPIKITGLALRSEHLGVMTIVARAEARAGGGHGTSAARGLTLLASTQWQHVVDELGAPLPWHTRRANVLLDADTLAPLIGRTIAVGPVRVRVLAETNPCTQMDLTHRGLRQALEPHCRGGVYGRILAGGTIEVGQEVVVGDA
jgi:MOSC domain-containing protein YiiM